jgi:cell wall assembly regulator SMI1
MTVDFSAFPTFANLVDDNDLENVLPGATDAEIAAIENKIGISLPLSYKNLLKASRGFWLMGASIQFDTQHPFFHAFPALNQLSQAQQAAVSKKGGAWPPPSNGMLCFAEFFMEADGDQVLFDVSQGLVNGEYPIVYYAHSARPASTRVLANSFEQFMNEFLTYPEFS